MMFNAASFLIRTLPSVQEFHLLSPENSGVADFTAGMEFHHSPKIVYYKVLIYICRGGAYAPPHKGL